MDKGQLFVIKEEGDSLIPAPKLSDTAEYQIGKYGRMRKRFLEENQIFYKTAGGGSLFLLCGSHEAVTEVG